MAVDDELDEQQPDEAYALDAFRRECTRGQAVFEAVHGHAFLLLRRAGEKRLQVPEKPSRTLNTSLPALRQELPPSRYLVFPIRKTERSLIERFYSVGQTRNNDVVVRDVSVSKFHAFFQHDAAGGFVLQDARSTNGTFVNGVRVPAQGEGQPVALSSGDRVRFGAVELSFLSATEFRALVQAVAPET
jgi:hypothetical protein